MKCAKVLIIDDCPDGHLLLEARLKHEGIELHHAYDAPTGLTMASELQPDLILLDIDLPFMTGLEVCTHLKRNPDTSALPVIFLSGASDVWTKVQGLELGAVDYVTKPFHAAELCARVRAALRAKRMQDTLSIHADVDALTGLHNRATFDRRLERDFAAARAGSTRLTLMMVDIDHFKQLNDQFGHPFGDDALRAVAQILRRGVRASDSACRYGGEEFAVLMPGCDRDEAALVAARIRSQLAELVVSRGGQTARVTASFGVADDRDLDSAMHLLDSADAALYRAKRSGRNRVELCRATPDRDAASEAHETHAGGDALRSGSGRGL